MSSQAEQLQSTMAFFKLDRVGQSGSGSLAARKSSTGNKKPAMKHIGGKSASKFAQAADADLDESQFSKF